MRVSDLMLGNSYLRNFNSIKNRKEELQTRIITLSKINNPSDSPSGTSKLLRLNKSLNASETYVDNIHNSLAYLQEAENAMQNIQTNISEVRILMVNVNNVVNESLYDSYADKIDMIITSILGFANEEYDGRFLFGGTDTSAKPFGFTADGLAIEQKVPDVSGKQKVKISSNITQQINISGDELFGAIGVNDIFNNLISIRDDLRSGNRPTQANEDALNSYDKKILDVLTNVGSINNRLTDSEELLNNRILSTQELMSDVKDVDMVEALINLQQQDYLLEIAYKISATILPKSLVDYI